MHILQFRLNNGTVVETSREFESEQAALEFVAINLIKLTNPSTVWYSDTSYYNKIPVIISMAHVNTIEIIKK